MSRIHNRDQGINEVGKEGSDLDLVWFRLRVNWNRFLRLIRLKR
jgi:hypothetical protein